MSITCMRMKPSGSSRSASRSAPRPRAAALPVLPSSSCAGASDYQFLIIPPTLEDSAFSPQPSTRFLIIRTPSMVNTCKFHVKHRRAIDRHRPGRCLKRHHSFKKSFVLSEPSSFEQPSLPRNGCSTSDHRKGCIAHRRCNRSPFSHVFWRRYCCSWGRSEDPEKGIANSSQRPKP